MDEIECSYAPGSYRPAEEELAKLLVSNEAAFRTEINNMKEIREELALRRAQSELNPASKGEHAIALLEKIGPSLGRWQKCLNKSLEQQQGLHRVREQMGVDKVSLLLAVQTAPKIQPHWLNPDGLCTNNYQRGIVSRGHAVQSQAINTPGPVSAHRRLSTLAGLPKGKAAIRNVLQIPKPKGKKAASKAVQE